MKEPAAESEQRREDVTRQKIIAPVLLTKGLIQLADTQEKVALEKLRQQLRDLRTDNPTHS